MAALIAIFGTYPLDLVQTHLTVQTKQNSKYKGILQTIATITKEEGILQLYRGIGITILVHSSRMLFIGKSSAPAIALNMVLWEKLKDAVNSRIYGEINDHKIHPLVSAFCGSVAGTVSSTGM